MKPFMRENAFHRFVFIGVLLMACLLTISCDPEPGSGTDRVRLKINGERVTVRPLVTRRARLRGAVKLNRLADGEGVLFVYRRPLPKLYWANRSILGQALDVAFLGPDGTVLRVKTMEAGTGNVIDSRRRAQYILVLNEGWFRARTGGKGARVSIPPGLSGRAEPVYSPEKVRSISAGETEIRVELADTPTARERGLMNRKGLRKNHGMLFIYPEPRTVRYYMKNTLVPLDIAFLDAGGRIRSIHVMEPLRQKQVTSGEEIRYVLEMRRGWFEKHGVTAGDRVDLSALNVSSGG